MSAGEAHGPPGSVNDNDDDDSRVPAELARTATLAPAQTEELVQSTAVHIDEPPFEAPIKPPRTAMMSSMYHKQAEMYHELHRHAEEARRREAPANDDDEDGDPDLEPSVRGHSPKKNRPTPGFMTGKRGASFLPSHLLRKDVEARHSGEAMSAVLGRMTHRYHRWQQELAQATRTEIPISAWNQSAFKYVFHDTFDETLDPAEIQSLAGLVVSVAMNLAVVVINLFINTPQFSIPSTQVAATIVFIVEFVFVMLGFVILVFTTVHAFIRNQVTTGLALDVVDMARFVGEFSVLQIVRLLSPGVVLGYVLPFIAEARTTADYVRGTFVVVLWLFGIFLAAVCLVLKVSQVSFVSDSALNDWSITNWLAMFGLLLNLAKVDGSYEAVAMSLLESVHKHYIGPGEIHVRKAERSRSLFAKVMTKILGIRRDAVFSFFGTVFNYHFGDDNTTDEADLPMGVKLRKALNFMSFVAKLDNRMLERFLEMVDSPMYHYQVGRRMFAESVAEGDISGMEMAIWLCDPMSDEAAMLAERYPKAFRVNFYCDDK